MEEKKKEPGDLWEKLYIQRRSSWSLVMDEAQGFALLPESKQGASVSLFFIPRLYVNTRT